MDPLVEVIRPELGAAQIGIRQAPHGVVEEIKGLHTKLQGVSFPDPEVLVSGEVQGESGRSGYVCLLLSQLTWALDRQPNSDFRMRRQSLASKANGRVVLLFASNEAEGPNDLYGYRPDDNFFYLSGWSEPGAALLIVGAADPKDHSYTEILFFPITILRRKSGPGRSLERTVLMPAGLRDSTMSRCSTICGRSWSACFRQRRRPSIPTWSPMAKFRIQRRLWIG